MENTMLTIMIIFFSAALLLMLILIGWGVYAFAASCIEERKRLRKEDD